VIAYAGSQVTKAPRLAGAVVLAPSMDKLLDMLQTRLRLKSKWQAGTCTFPNDVYMWVRGW
jgi:dipeptidyl aminopeptidase/acylaminoacyl peptidase